MGANGWEGVRRVTKVGTAVPDTAHDRAPDLTAPRPRLHGDRRPPKAAELRRRDRHGVTLRSGPRAANRVNTVSAKGHL